MKKIIIIASKPGQMGNLLAVYSHFIAFSIERNYLLLNPAFHEYAQLFTGSFGNRLGSQLNNLCYRFSFYIARAITKLHLNSTLIQAIYLDWDQTIDLDTVVFKSRITFVQGWLYRGTMTIRKHQTYIRNYFTPVPQYAEVIRKYREQFNRDRIIVGVHIRHGDYKLFEDGKYFYTIEQYRTAMISITELFDKRVCFLICSNADFDESVMKGLLFQKGPGFPIGDLYTLAACQYIMGPPSSFTSWASFYGQVPVYHIHNPDAPCNFSNFQVWEAP